ncbi:MAG: DivIVA domain-containing protein, partial [Microthrixaceae bacterium]
MVDPIPDPPDLAPEDLSAVEFGRSRKGYEPVEVTALLGRAADAIRAWQERDRRLQDRVVSLAADLDAAQVIDEDRITAALGEETARIIAAARDAASEIRSRAEQEAARLVEEADAAADETRSAAIEETAAARSEAERERTEATLSASAMRQDAERYADELRATAQAEHDELVAAAESVLAERTAEADGVAAGIRETAEVERDALIAEGERAREDARGLAAAEIDRARDDAVSMMDETKEIRTKMLRDLAERHREAHRQIDVARAERDRIVDAIRSLGASLDGTVGELVGDTDDSGFAGGFDSGPRASMSVDEFVVEIEANLRPVRESAGSPMSPLVGSARAVTAGDDPDDVGVHDSADDGADDDGADDDGADDGGVDDATDDVAVAAATDELPEDATREEIVLDARLLESGRFGDGAASDGSDDDDDSDDADADGAPKLAAVATVHDLFERVRDESPEGGSDDDESPDGAS